MIHRFFQSQLKEITNDPVLRFHGCCLALVNVLTGFFWLYSEPVAQILSPIEPAVCWPILPGCRTLRVLESEALQAIIGVFLFLSLICAGMFARSTLSKFGYWLLVSLTAVKTTVVLQDYRLIHNQHYMAQWVTLAFLFVPHKREVLPRLLVLFYFAAGLLKLNTAWLSGAALYDRRPFGLPADLIPAACWYVVALELVIVFGLLSRSRTLWWAAFAQLIGFHVSSFWVVGYFYPVLMFLLLAALPITRWAGSNSSELATHLAARRSIVAVTLTFAAFQLAPRAYSTEPSITGEGRFLALHMFDAPTDCLAMRTYRAAGGREWSDAVHPRFVYPRIACDPLVHYELAASYCKQYPLEDGHPDFRMTLSTRRYGESEFRTIVSLNDFCARRPPYSPWWHNPWITTR